MRTNMGTGGVEERRWWGWVGRGGERCWIEKHRGGA